MPCDHKQNNWTCLLTLTPLEVTGLVECIYLAIVQDYGCGHTPCEDGCDKRVVEHSRRFKI